MAGWGVGNKRFVVEKGKRKQILGIFAVKSECSPSQGQRLRSP